MATLGQRLREAGYRPAGFDYIRLVLASAVIVWHSFTLLVSPDAGAVMATTPGGIASSLILPMFFGLSGFLVTGSLERTQSVLGFLGLRALRILPGLVVVSAASALALGPLFTVLPLKDYVADPAFRSYFWNFIGWIHYDLPGVFLQNPYGSAVNGQLWSVQLELESYLALAGLAFVGLVGRPRFFALLVVAGQVVLLAQSLRPDAAPVATHRLLVCCFFDGALLYKYRESIPARLDLFFGAVVLTAACSAFPKGAGLLALPVAYIVAFLGTLNPRRLLIVASGDYSFGIYVWGFPVQQALVALGAAPLGAGLNFMIAYLITFVAAILSWHAVEKPFLRLKGHLSAADKWLLSMPPLDWHSRTVYRPTKGDAAPSKAEA